MMAASRSDMKFHNKMMKKLAGNSVPDGETLNFYDLGTLISAEEVATMTKTGIVKTYAVALVTAGIGSAVGARGAAMRSSASEYAYGQFESDQCVAVVTDRHIRIIQVESKQSGFSPKWVRIRGSEDIVFPLDEVVIELGEPSKGSVFGKKWTTTPVTFLNRNGNGFMLHFLKEDKWRELAPSSSFSGA